MRRFPTLTVVVALVTMAGLVVQETVPGTLQHLQRSPAALHGDWWRWVTSMVTQDGWLAGGLFNILGLLLVGIAAEQVASRGVWLTAYVGTGVMGQAFGQRWQPVGAGNSVAVCGLAALCVFALITDDAAVRMPFTSIAPAVWAGWLAAAIWTPLLFAGAVFGVLAGGPLQRFSWCRYVAPVFCAVCAVLLFAAADIHGGALTVALVVAGVVAAVGRPSRRRSAVN